MKAEDVLLALCCFMQDCTPEATSTIGSIRTTDEEKILLAKQSCPWNAQQETFRTYFSDLVGKWVVLCDAALICPSQQMNMNIKPRGLLES